MGTRNMFIENKIIVKMLKQTQIPMDIKIFTGKELSLVADDDPNNLTPEWNGEKFDFMFVTAENLAKFSFHPYYQFNLKKLVEKFGNENTKIFILGCCDICNSKVIKFYEIPMEFIENNHWNKMADDIANALKK